MVVSRSVGVALLFAAALNASAPAIAQSASSTVDLTVAAGRPLRVALDQTVRIRRVGQPVSGTLVEPVYAYDRIVLPAGTPVRGHVVRLVDPSRRTRLRAMANGDFSVPRQVVLDFDSLSINGEVRPIHTLAARGIERLRREVAAGPDVPPGTGIVGRTEGAITARVGGTVAAIKEPRKLGRLKEGLLNRLPYHPQFLDQGTVYSAELQSALSFGVVAASRRAPAGTRPAPDSALTARLVTPVDSAKASRGTVVTAVVTEPVFSASHELVLPEGVILDGEVTFAAPARRWHRNGQLRFLFERARAGAEAESTPMLASLYSVDVGQGDRVTLDDEGGAKVNNSPKRFIAPALAVLALQGSIDQDHHRFDNDGDPYDLGQAPAPASGHWGSRGLGGFLGFGLVGAGLGQIARPVGIALATVGAARTVYKNVVGKGNELSFPADTLIRVRLAPGKRPDP